MSVKPPKKKPDEIEIETQISKGAPVAEDEKKKDEEWTHINIRMPRDMMDRLDSFRKRGVTISRTLFILNTLHKTLYIGDSNE